ncbi:MAG: integrase arm-type DNA-binding domain-containing protein [Holophagales bacterium]|jgi:integrase|nr:integrase arm-type DNA-binding domain-containing protein [Holophagales bacterium]
MGLTDLGIKRAKPAEKPYRLFDGGGLYIEIQPSGGRLWRYKYHFNDKEKRLAIGRYPEISLQDARQRHFEARKMLANGIDPSAAKKAAKSAKRGIAENSFEVLAREWHENWRLEKSEIYTVKAMKQLERDVFPYIGRIPVAELKAPDVLAVCRRVEARGAISAAHKINISISLIMRYAIATGRAERDPCPDLRGALKPHPSKPFPSLTDPEKVAGLLKAIDCYKGTHVVRCALAIAPLVFVRPNELRHARWKDIDLERREWVFIYSKQKKSSPVGRKLVVPLSTQALAILQDIQQLTGDGEYVFPGMRSGRPLSEPALNVALQTLGFDTSTEITLHGFRAMARTILAERLRFDPQFIERQLSHKTRENLGESYDRTQFLEQRKEMMQAWADYLDKLKRGEVE